MASRELKIFFGIAVLSITLLLSSCNSVDQSDGLRAGDILFQDLDCGEMCDAIEAVTQGVNGRDFSHCALVVKLNDTLKVVEAIGDGVIVTNLIDFYERVESNPEKMAIGRLKEEHSELIEGATDFALNQVGAEYDDLFLLENGRWYCSELLYESFRIANDGEEFFLLEPMTFKEPKSDNFFPAWVEHYTELGACIPEGELGLNPGSISRSGKLDILFF